MLPRCAQRRHGRQRAREHGAARWAPPPDRSGNLATLSARIRYHGCVWAQAQRLTRLSKRVTLSQIGRLSDPGSREEPGHGEHRNRPAPEHERANRRESQRIGRPGFEPAQRVALGARNRPNSRDLRVYAAKASWTESDTPLPAAMLSRITSKSRRSERVNIRLAVVAPCRAARMAAGDL